MLLLVSGKLDLEICIDEFTSGQSFLLSVENWGVELLIRVEKNNHYSCAKTEELSLSLSLSLSLKYNNHSQTQHPLTQSTKDLVGTCRKQHLPNTLIGNHQCVGGGDGYQVSAQTPGGYQKEIRFV
jgi:hypothetical protein